MLYILIPSAAIILINYFSWWSEIPQWVETVSPSVVFVICFLFIWSGYFRTYVREADQIYLIKNRKLYLNLKRKGILYSYLTQIVHTVFLGVLIGPFWFNFYQFDIGQFILLTVFFLSSKWLIMSVKGKLNIHLGGWKSLLKSIPIFAVIAMVWMLYYNAFQVNQMHIMLGIIIFNILSSVFLIKKRANSIETFSQDLAIEEFEINKYVDLIFRISIDIEKQIKPLSQRKSPILYSNSNRLFKKRSPRNGYLELFIKIITRQTEYVFRYIQIIGITSLAIALIPLYIYKIMIFLFSLLFIQTWLRSVWTEVIGSHPFTKKYVKEVAYSKGKRIVTFLFSLIFLVLISMFIIVRILISTYV